MKQMKNAFTLAESLIFLSIVGVISVLMMTIIKPQERYLPYAYYSAYNALATAAMNIREDANINMQDTSTDTEIADVDKYFPGGYSEHSDVEVAKVEAAKELCKKLAVQASTAEEYGYINTTEYNCSSFEPLLADGTAPTSDRMAFRATNSMKFFISAYGDLEFNDSMNGGKKEFVRYFIVWVDLNGDRNPNTAEWKENKPADIVPFIITTSGSVLPAGAPIVDPRYTTARVQYATDTISKYLPYSKTYLEAQGIAYGDKQYPRHDHFSLDFTGKITKLQTENYEARIADDINSEKCSPSANNSATCTLVIDENIRL